MEMTIEHSQDVSTMSSLSIRSLCAKRVAIAIISVTVVAVVGWQIQVNVIQKIDSRSSQGSTMSFPIQSLAYIEQFLDSSISNDTLHKCLPHRKKKFMKFENDIRQIMDQKMAIEQLFSNIKCPRDDFKSEWPWYNLILTSKPTIHMHEQAAYLPQLTYNSFDFDGVCRSHHGEILHINVSYISCSGSVDLTSLPRSLEILKLNDNEFTGSVDLSSLPQSLKALMLVKNKFTGTIDLTSLPDDLAILELEGNQFTGTVDLTLLPQSLEILSLSENQFTGSVDLKSLPQSLTALMLGHNKFMGTVDLTSLPPLLEYLDLSHNHFKGFLDLTKLPDGLNHLQLELYNKSSI